jgi:MerR family transcriptional regulator, light-induced transcriptional regulator
MTSRSRSVSRSRPLPSATTGAHVASRAESPLGCSTEVSSGGMKTDRWRAGSTLAVALNSTGIGPRSGTYSWYHPSVPPLARNAPHCSSSLLVTRRRELIHRPPGRPLKRRPQTHRRLLTGVAIRKTCVFSPSRERTERPSRREVDKATRRLSRTYQDALTVADAGGAGRVARQALGEGIGVAGLYQRVIAPAMWRIGELWEQGTISVADEHLATALTHQTMASIYGPSLGHKVKPGRILMAAVEGEQHALGLRMATDIVELAGYETIYLGTNVPTVDLLQAVAARSPDLVGLSATMPSSIQALDRAIAEIQRVNLNLIVLFGGQGVQPRERNDGAVLVRDLEQLLGMVEAALDFAAPGPKDSSAPRVPPPERVIALGDPQGTVPAVPGESVQEGESVERHLSGIAAETADLARDLARQANTYKDLAYTDTLSGLPNRRAFEDRAARLRDFSDAKPLAVLMIDLDGFKPVNDSEGHEAGRSNPRLDSPNTRRGASRRRLRRSLRWRRVCRPSAPHRFERGRGTGGTTARASTGRRLRCLGYREHRCCRQISVLPAACGAK